MKTETLIYNKIKKIIPVNAETTAVYAGVNDTSYEIFFFSRLPDRGYVQCYRLAEEGAADILLQDIVFRDMAEIIRKDVLFDGSKLNIFTFIINEDRIEKYIKYADSDNVYNIKKEWKNEYIGN